MKVLTAFDAQESLKREMGLYGISFYFLYLFFFIFIFRCGEEELQGSAVFPAMALSNKSLHLGFTGDCVACNHHCYSCCCSICGTVQKNPSQ
jgi:hypothetical protein